MTKATLNVQHEYITARTVWSKGCTLNLTTSYSGEKCTARGVEGETMKRIWKAFLLHRKLTGEGKLYADNGKQMEGVRRLGEKSTNPVNFAELLEAEVSKAHNVDPVKVAEKMNTLTEVAPPKPAAKKDYSQDELQAAFNKVRNSKDWKVRIDRTIPKADLDITIAAIIHFHGAMPYTVPHANPEKVIIRSKGYAC